MATNHKFSIIVQYTCVQYHLQISTRLKICAGLNQDYVPVSLEKLNIVHSLPELYKIGYETFPGSLTAGSHHRTCREMLL